MPTLGFRDNDGIDVGNKFVTKEYVMNTYPDLLPSMITPQLWTWGLNASGQLGDNTTSNRSSPVTTASGGTNWKQVSCGYNHTAAVKTDGTLWTWGLNTFGQLGDGTASTRSSPVTTAGGGTNWKQVSCGYSFTAAVKTDGTLWTWGLNNNNQLGDGTGVSKNSPVTTAGGGTNWKQVASGHDFALAIKIDGTLWVWGNGAGGVLGTGDTARRSSPVTTAGGGTNWKQAAANFDHSAAIKADGTLWTWGRNTFGQLGDGYTSRSSPGTTSGGGTDWKSISAGDRFSAAIKTDGTLWTWGSNGYGKLGTGTTTDRSSPGTTAGGGTSWLYVSAGRDSLYAIRTDGTLWSCGNNFYGQLGTGDSTGRSSLARVTLGPNNWKQVQANRHVVVTSESEGW